MARIRTPPARSGRVARATAGNRTLDRLETAAGAAALLAVILFHVRVMLSAGALWRDEVSTLELACKPTFGEFWSNLVFDPFPALYFLALRAWCALGFAGSDAGLRALGLVVGLGIVGALLASARMLGVRVPLVALLLLGWSPVVIRWGDAVRAYGLGTITILLAFGLLWRMSRRPTPARVAAAALAAILSVHCMYQNAVLLLGIGLGVIAVSARRRSFRPAAWVAGIGLATALSLVPYAGTLRQAQDWTILSRSPIGVGWLWGVLAEALGAPWPGMVWIWLALGLASIVGAARAQSGLAETERADRTLFAAVAWVTGAAGFMILLRIISFPTQVWYYVVLLAFAALGIEAALSAPATIRFRRVRLGLFAVMAAALSVPTWRVVGTRHTNVDSVASEVALRAAPSDLVLVSPWHIGVSFQRYYRGGAPWATVPELEDHAIHRWDQVKQRMITASAIDALLASVETTLRTGGRIWLVGSFPRLEPGTLPEILPPAPESSWGWDNDRYTLSWTLQISHRLQSHALAWELVQNRSSAPVDHFENLVVQSVRGWR